ncbi:YodC family protein [Brevundimonas naejangsanensis]
MAIQKGSTVQLKSGGPIMTVEWYEHGSANCSWFDDKMQHHNKMFQLEALKEVPAP